jgi:hypothetical protein
MWRNNEVRAFVDWLRSHNIGYKPTSRVAFHGLDLYSLYDSIRFVLEYLEDVDPKSAKVAQERYGCLTPWQSDPATYGHAALTGRYPTCETDVAHALSDLLQKREAYAAHDGERFLDAVQNARLVTNAERYYRIMYYGSRASWNLRDEHMFNTLKTLLAYHGERSKGIVWAHNSHIGNAEATEMSARGEHNIGQLCRKEFGQNCYAIGFMLVPQIPGRTRSIIHDAVVAFSIGQQHQSLLHFVGEGTWSDEKVLAKVREMVHQPCILHRVEETLTIVGRICLAFLQQIAERVCHVGFASGISAGKGRMAIGGRIGLPGRQAAVSFARDLGGLWIHVIEVFQNKADGIVQAVQI